MIKNEKNVLYMYGILLFIGWGLQFAMNVNHYSNIDIMTGMMFICIVLICYFSCVYLYRKSPFERNIVLYSLFLIAVISINIVIF